MGIVNKRNAFVGWLVLKFGKRVAKKKAAAVGSALFFWRRKRGAAGGA